MTTAPALTAPRIHFSNPTEPEKLAATVLNSPRLLAAVPSEELSDLFTAYTAATRATAKARLLPAVEHADAVTDLDKRLRAGEEIDPARLVAELSAAQAAREARARTVELLNSMPGRYASEIVAVLGDYEDDYYDEALAPALAEILDAAAAVAAELEGIDSAEAAIDAGKAEVWARLRPLAQELASVRADHFALLRTADPLTTSTAPRRSPPPSTATGARSARRLGTSGATPPSCPPGSSTRVRRRRCSPSPAAVGSWGRTSAGPAWIPPPRSPRSTALLPAP